MNFFYQLTNNSFYVKLLIAIFLLFVFLAGRKLLSRLAIRLLAKIEITHSRLEIGLFDRLQKPLDYLFLVTGFYVALAASPFVNYSKLTNESFWMIKTQIPLSVIPFTLLNKVYGALFIALCTWTLYDLEHIYEGILSNISIKVPFIDNTLFIRFTAKLIRFFTVLIGTFISLNILIPNISSVITGLGLGGVAVAFVSKDALSDILTGMFFIMDKPFVIGDWIEIDGLEGTVEDITFRSTRIRTFTQGLIMMPNAQISSENIINWTRMKKRRVKFELGVSYHTQVATLNECITRIKDLLAAHPDIENESFLVAFENFGDYTLNIQITYFSLRTDYASYLSIKETINIQILELCHELGVNIAFPTQTVIIENPTPLD